MKALIVAVVGVLLLAGIAVAVHPSVHGAYVRHRAAGDLRDAEVLRDRMTSPVAKQALADAGDQLKFALMRPEVPLEDVAQFDRELELLMASLKTSAPPDNPIEVTAFAEPRVTAGGTTTVRVVVHSFLPEVFLVSVTAQLRLDSGWQSVPATKTFGKSIAGTPVETTLEIQVPAGIAGAAHLRATASYRLNPTGEGRDLQAQPSTPPAIVITSGR